MPRTWPLVGRDEELRVAEKALGPRNDRSGVVLSGPAGVGKTRLAREVMARSGHSQRVGWALATESARQLPLAAFGDLLDGIGPPGPEALTRAAEHLTRRPDRRPPVLGVDDAHLLDDVSAVLVHRLVTRHRACVVLTVRDGEPAPDAIAALWKDDHLSRLAVAPLPETATRDLLGRVLGGLVADSAVRRLWRLTRGNALFLRHLVDSELTTGRLRRIDDIWCWPGASEISAELAEIVRRQMGDLPPGVRDTVDVLALAEPLDDAVVHSLTRADALEAAEARGLVRAEREGGRWQVRLCHPMYGEVRRAELGVVRARRLRGMIAETMLAIAPDVGTVRRAVLHAESDLPPDPDLFLDGAERAFGLLDLELAARLARAAAEAGGGFDAELLLAHACSWSSDGEEADRILAGLAAQATGDLDRMRVALPRSGNLFWTLNNASEAEKCLDDALAAVTDDAARGPLLAMQIAIGMCLGRVHEAFDAGNDLIEAGTLPPGPRLMVAGSVLGAAAVLGRLDDVRRAASIGHEAAGEEFNAVIPEFGLTDWEILGLRLAGDVPAAREAAHRMEHLAGDVPGPARLMGLVLTGHAVLASGEIGSAQQVLREAMATLGPSGHEFRFRCRVLLALALALGGDAAGARPLLRLVESEKHPAYAVMQPDEMLLRAWVIAAEGSVSEAVKVVHDAASLAQEMDAPAYEVLALQTVTQYGDAGSVTRLGELAEVVEGPRAPAALAHARALADRDGDALVAVSRRWEEMGDLLAAVDAAAQAANQYQRSGRRGSGLAAAQRAHRLADERCEGVWTPALAAAERPLPLTDREREVATLAARGLSNKEIAARLTVSIRTVEGHLYRVCQKLGVHERSELVGLLGIG